MIPVPTMKSESPAARACPPIIYHRLRNRFEHLGDTVLGLIVTGLLHDIYPNLRVGPSTVRPLFLDYCIPLTRYCTENTRPYRWQCHSRVYFLQIRLARRTQAAPRPGYHAQGQYQHTRQAHLFHPLRHHLTCPSQPTSSKSVYPKYFIWSLADDILLFLMSVLRRGPLSRSGPYHHREMAQGVVQTLCHSSIYPRSQTTRSSSPPRASFFPARP